MNLRPLVLLVFYLKTAFCLRAMQRMCILLALPQTEQHINDCVRALQNVTTAEDVQLNVVSSREVYAATVNFVSSVFHMSNGGGCSEVIGVVGDLDSQTASIIHTLASRVGLNITLVATSTPSTFLPVTNLNLPNLLDLDPLQHYVNALVSFIEKLSWNRIGLVTDDTPSHLFATELLQRKLFDSGVTVKPCVRITKANRNSIERLLQQFEEYGTQIIVVLASGDIRCSLLSMAVEVGYTWPQYALIVLDLDLQPQKCQVSNEGVIRLKHSEKFPEQEAYNEDCAADNGIFRSAYLGVTLTRSFFNSTNQPPRFTPTSSNFRNNSLLNNISVVQDNTVIGTYNSELQELDFSPDSLLGEEIPRGTFKIVVYRSSELHIAVVLVLVLLCFRFITVNLVLYIAFRHEPEVKATSVSVSICMFLGCYLLVLFVLMLLLAIQPLWRTSVSRTFICTVPTVLANVSPSMILATLIVKMLRVYLIFCKPHSYKKKFFSNPALLLYIVVLLSPVIFILFLMIVTDKLTKVTNMTHLKSHALAYDKCRNSPVWSASVNVYDLILIIALAILTRKTSKIRFKHFHDAKATNAYIYLSILVSIMAAVYWNFFYDFLPLTFKNIDKSVFSLYVGYILVALLCQSFLFAPKVYPPTMRWLRRKRVKSKVHD